jgi:hypothetical protein
MEQITQVAVVGWISLEYSFYWTSWCNGGKGIVIIRYTDADRQKATGGTVTTPSGYTSFTHLLAMVHLLPIVILMVQPLTQSIKTTK